EVVGVVLGFCLWQNHALLHIINKPLQTQTEKQVGSGRGTVGQAVLAQQGVLKVAGDVQAALAVLSRPDSGLSAPARAQLAALVASLHGAVGRIPRNPPGDKPVTLGVGEPFTTTITVSLYFALVIALPIILFELYGFILPALNPNERRVAIPLLVAVPFLFAAGVAFGYFVVLPAAIRFFVNFNASQFNVLTKASQFYKFACTVLLAMGLVFQVPVVIVGATRLGLVTPKQLRKNRRYAIVACAAVAAFLPGDLITLMLETVPLYLLYELSILIASFVSRGESMSAAGAGEPRGDPAAASGQGLELRMQQIIDHVDPELSD